MVFLDGLNQWVDMSNTILETGSFNDMYNRLHLIGTFIVHYFSILHVVLIYIYTHTVGFFIQFILLIITVQSSFVGGFAQHSFCP